MLKVNSLSKSYQKEIFKNLNWELESGSICILSGPNGAGKTSLLRMLCGALLADSGSILWNNEESVKIRKKIGIAFASDGGFSPRLSVKENICFAGSFYGLSKAETEKRINELNFFEIDFWDRPIEEISMGMRQKVRLLRPFLHEPELLLFDEPLNGLDTKARDQFKDFIKKWIQTPQRLIIIAQHGLKWDDCPAWEIKKNNLVKL